MIEVEIACCECGCVIVLLDPSIDLVEEPLCFGCRNRQRAGCEELNEQTGGKKWRK